MTKKLNLIVLGGGVVGLTCALLLSERHTVKVVANKFGTETESVKATAIWHVYLVPETERILCWAEITLQKLLEIAANIPAAGVELVSGTELFRSQARHVPAWSKIPRMFRMLTSAEIAHFNTHNVSENDPETLDLLRRHPVTWGYRVEAPAARMTAYLEWLLGLVKARGVVVERKLINDLNSIGAGYDAVINCSGFGARELVKDDTFLPFKGQYYVVEADQDAPIEYIGDDDFPSGMAYVIARGGEVMVGGSAEEGIEDFTPTLSWESVVHRAGVYVPWLRRSRQEGCSRRIVVCIRPARTGGVRLERQRLCNGGIIVHNYGHGGSGFSLSWGCAEEVARLVEE
jgi:D-amino-acid oxidase